MSGNVSLRKVTLTKENSTVDLRKRDSGGFGRISINLQWSQPEAPKGGGLLNFFGSKKPAGIDLDLGCLYELSDGRKSCVQALGNAFGSFDEPPYIMLSQDDRTGASAEGEFLYLNGDKWPSISRILVYAFIYEGVANWAQADGRVIVSAPGQDAIEVRLDDSDNRHTMCAIAMLENVGGAIRASRQARYFASHREMDGAFGWGLRWQAGSKD